MKTFRPIAELVNDAQRENEMLKKLVTLRQENAAMRLRLSLPGDDAESLQRLVALVCAEFNVTEEQLRSRCRTEPLVYPRHVAFWLLRELTTLSSSIVGEYFERDHGTVLHGVNAVQDRASDPRYRRRLMMIRDKAQELLALKGNGNGDREA